MLKRATTIFSNTPRALIARVRVVGILDTPIFFQDLLTFKYNVILLDSRFYFLNIR